VLPIQQYTPAIYSYSHIQGKYSARFEFPTEADRKPGDRRRGPAIIRKGRQSSGLALRCDGEARRAQNTTARLVRPGSAPSACVATRDPLVTLGLAWDAIPRVVPRVGRHNLSTGRAGSRRRARGASGAGTVQHLLSSCIAAYAPPAAETLALPRARREKSHDAAGRCGECDRLREAVIATTAYRVRSLSYQRDASLHDRRASSRNRVSMCVQRWTHTRRITATLARGGCAAAHRVWFVAATPAAVLCQDRRAAIATACVRATSATGTGVLGAARGACIKRPDNARYEAAWARNGRQNARGRNEGERVVHHGISVFVYALGCKRAVLSDGGTRKHM
jgi:hypothetical protein